MDLEVIAEEAGDGFCEGVGLDGLVSGWVGLRDVGTRTWRGRRGLRYSSGPIGQLDALKAYLDQAVHYKSVRLTIPFGYHSSAMQPLLEEFGALAKRVTVYTPKIPVISNPLGRVIREEDKSAFNAGYYLSHCADPVQFESGISALIGDASAWIELGPHPTTLPMLTVHPGVSKEAFLVSSLKKRQDDRLTLSSSLSQLYTSDVPCPMERRFR